MRNFEKLEKFEIFWDFWDSIDALYINDNIKLSNINSKLLHYKAKTKIYD